MTVPPDLDRIDFGLLSTLQQNANQRLEDLGKRVGLAPSSVHERLRRLEDKGVIRRWTIACDADALGLPVLAFVGVRASRPCSDLREPLEAIQAIEECHSVAGGLSLLLKVRVESPRALLDLTNRLRTIPGVEGTDTTIVLATQFDRPVTASKPGSAEPQPGPGKRPENKKAR
jgi:Lrp/AsnC family leucine-responsive transcriptional regulator